jgi:hypothetical protein
MDKSRAKKSAAVSKLSFSSSIDFAGKCLWYMGLLGQIIWNIMALVAIVQHDNPEALESFLHLPPIALLEPAIYTSTSRTWASSSLLCTVASFWWNPMFKQMNNGFMNHIKGFGDWYKLQFLLVVIRSLFYYIMGTGLFADPFSAVSTGAHIFFPCFVTLVCILLDLQILSNIQQMAFRALRSLRIDMSPLWASTPEKLPHVGPRSGSPIAGVDSMADALDQIAATPSRKSRQLSPSSPSPPPYALQGFPKRIQAQQLSSTPPAPSRSLLPQIRTSPSLLEMTHAESVRYLATGEVPVHLQQRYNVNETEEMEWTPSQSQSQHRAFNPPRSLQRQTELFGQAPTGDQPSPFWYKVPPAPITPAQRLRNPPNQPRLRVSSQETKENFFNNITHRNSGTDTAGRQAPPLRDEVSRPEIEFAQQKFFPPPPPSEAGNTLADLLTSFSLDNSETESHKLVEASSTTRHICQSIALFLGIFFWNYTFHNPTEHSRNVMMTVMIACALIGFRTTLDNTTFKRAGSKTTAVQGIGACLGGLEAIAAVYGILHILAGNGDCENCASLGTILTGGMLVHQIWLAFFG